MLQRMARRWRTSCCFDLAPTGALCYSLALHDGGLDIVLISLPQERCATTRNARI